MRIDPITILIQLKEELKAAIKHQRVLPEMMYNWIEYTNEILKEFHGEEE